SRGSLPLPLCSSSSPCFTSFFSASFGSDFFYQASRKGCGSRPPPAPQSEGANLGPPGVFRVERGGGPNPSPPVPDGSPPLPASSPTPARRLQSGSPPPLTHASLLPAAAPR